MFVLGQTGVGKSSTCNTLCYAEDGKKVKISHGTNACTDGVIYQKVYWKDSID